MIRNYIDDFDYKILYSVIEARLKDIYCEEDANHELVNIDDAAEDILDDILLDLQINKKQREE